MLFTRRAMQQVEANMYHRLVLGRGGCLCYIPTLLRFSTLIGFRQQIGSISFGRYWEWLKRWGSQQDGHVTESKRKLMFPTGRNTVSYFLNTSLTGLRSVYLVYGSDIWRFYMIRIKLCTLLRYFTSRFSFLKVLFAPVTGISTAPNCQVCPYTRFTRPFGRISPLNIEGGAGGVLITISTNSFPILSALPF